MVAEYGPGEGCHTREMLKRAHPESKFLLFELDPEFCRDLERQFADDPRVTVVNDDCATLPDELSRQNLTHCDYVLSGIPFSILEINKKRQLLQKDFRRPEARRRFRDLSGHQRIASPRHARDFSAGRQRIFPAKRPADVHHGIP